MAVNMVFGFNTTNFFINDATFVPPTVPVLLQILSGAQTAQELLSPGSVYTLPKNASIELTFPANVSVGGSPHPFHLHGVSHLPPPRPPFTHMWLALTLSLSPQHAFAVVRSAGSTEYNYDNPVWRDTVSTGAVNGDNVTIRFQTDNPGPWFLHCHIDFHLKTGFAVVLAEDVPDIQYANPVPQEWSNLCPTYDALSVDDQ